MLVSLYRIQLSRMEVIWHGAMPDPYGSLSKGILLAPRPQDWYAQWDACLMAAGAYTNTELVKARGLWNTVYPRKGTSHADPMDPTVVLDALRVAECDSRAGADRPEPDDGHLHSVSGP